MGSVSGGRHKPFENNLLQSIADAHQNRFLRSFCVGIFNGEWSLFEINTSTAYRRKFCYLGFLTEEKEMAQISSLDLGYVGESVNILILSLFVVVLL